MKLLNSQSTSTAPMIEEIIDEQEASVKPFLTSIPNSAKEENLENVLAKGAGFSMIGAVNYRALSYIYGIILARGLGASLYGLFSLGLANISVARTIALIGLVPGGLRFIARYRTQQDEASQRLLARTLFVLVFTWGSLISLALFLAADFFAQFNAQNSAQISEILRWFAPAIPLTALLYLLSGLAEGQRRIWVGVLARDTLQPLLALLFAGAIVLLNGTLSSIVGSYIVSVVVGILVTVLSLRSYFFGGKVPQRAAINFSLREVLSFSFPLFPSKILRDLTNRLEIFMLGIMAMPADVGVFTAALGTSAFVVFGLQAVIKMYGTLAAELHAKGEIEQLEQLQHLATRWATAFSLPAVIILALLGNEILTLFGSDFTGNGEILLLMAVGQFFNAAAGPVSSTLFMAGYSRLVLVNSIGALLVKIGLEFWLINQYGIVGAAIGSAAINISINLITVVEVQYLLGIRSIGRGLWQPLFAGAAAFIVGGPIIGTIREWNNIAILAIGGTLIAVVFSVCYWFVAPEVDKRIVFNALRRFQRMTNRANIKN